MAILRNDIVCKEYKDSDFYVYKRGGRTVLAVRNPHSRMRVLNDKNFQQTRMHADNLARAAVMASVIYRQLPANQRYHALYR